MRILIISPQRTGGTVFSKWLSFELSYKWLTEPFNINSNLHYEISYLMEVEDVVMKLNPLEWSYNYIDNQFYSSFDKIIGLTRNDVLDSSISYTKSVETGNFTKRYVVDEKWIEDNKEEIYNNLKELSKINNFVKEIDNSLQITYEGIYQNKNDIEKVKKYIGINDLKYVDMLDNKNRYRNNNNPQKLI